MKARILFWIEKNLQLEGAVRRDVAIVVRRQIVVEHHPRSGQNKPEMQVRIFDPGLHLGGHRDGELGLAFRLDSRGWSQ